MTWKRKLGSDAGASITAALLLFMVCAVIGAVLLTAGSASAGRLSRLAEMDKRYYSVASAAQLLARELDGRTVTLRRSRELTEETVTPFTVTADAHGGETVTPGAPAVRRTAVYATDLNGGASPDAVTAETLDGTEPVSAVGSSIDTRTLSFLTARAARLLFGPDLICNTDAAMARSLSGLPEEETGTLRLSHASSLPEAEDLAVLCAYTLKRDGTLVLTLTNDDGGEPYALTLTLQPAFTESETRTRTGDETPVVSPAAGGYQTSVTTVTTVTRTASVTWTVSSIG